MLWSAKVLMYLSYLVWRPNSSTGVLPLHDSQSHLLDFYLGINHVIGLPALDVASVFCLYEPR